MRNDTPHPSGNMLLQTLAMPADTNPSGDIFCGWIMSQMDMAGGILAKEVTQSRGCDSGRRLHSFHKTCTCR